MLCRGQRKLRNCDGVQAVGKDHWAHSTDHKWGTRKHVAFGSLFTAFLPSLWPYSHPEGEPRAPQSWSSKLLWPSLNLGDGHTGTCFTISFSLGCVQKLCNKATFKTLLLHFYFLCSIGDWTTTFALRYIPALSPLFFKFWRQSLTKLLLLGSNLRSSCLCLPECWVCRHMASCPGIFSLLKVCSQCLLKQQDSSRITYPISPTYLFFLICSPNIVFLFSI